MDENLIHNKGRMKQVIDFNDLRYGTITPTDIDGSIDWHNRAWVFIEYKTKGNEMPFGQRLFYERLCNDLSQIKPTIVIEAYHEEPPTNDIGAGTCIVSRYYYRENWRVPNGTITVSEAIQKFNTMVDGF